MTTNGAAPERGEYTLVVYHDGTRELALARVGDLVAFELEHKRKPDTGSTLDVLWMVWRALGQPEGDLQKWADRVQTFSADAEAIDEARRALPDPTTQVAAAGEL